MAKKKTKEYQIINYNSQRLKQEKRLKIIMFILAGLLILGGIYLVAAAFRNGLQVNMFQKPTETETMTPTPENTATYTPTATPSPTETPTVTPTPDGPFMYTVQEGDNCWYIAVDKFGVNLDVFMAINNLKDCNIKRGDQLVIPSKDQKMPTESPK